MYHSLQVANLGQFSVTARLLKNMFLARIKKRSDKVCNFVKSELTVKLGFGYFFFFCVAFFKFFLAGHVLRNVYKVW